MDKTINLLKVGNAILTPECIRRIETLQENKNELLEEELDILKDAIILLTLATYADEKRNQKKAMIIDNLAHMIELHEELAL